MTIGVGTAMAKDKPSSVSILTKSGNGFQWDINETQGIILDPDVSVARIMLMETEGTVEEEPEEQDPKATQAKEKSYTTRIMEILPWSEILHIKFAYDNLPATPTTVN